MSTATAVTTSSSAPQTPTTTAAAARGRPTWSSAPPPRPTSTSPPLSAARGFRIDGAAAGDQSGLSVSGAGDVNGDGRDDVIVGADAADNNGRGSSGSSYVVFGAADARARSSTWRRSHGARGASASTAPPSSDHSGLSVSGAGDVNGDGRTTSSSAPSSPATTAVRIGLLVRDLRIRRPGQRSTSRAHGRAGLPHRWRRQTMRAASRCRARAMSTVTAATMSSSAPTTPITTAATPRGRRTSSILHAARGAGADRQRS